MPEHGEQRGQGDRRRERGDEDDGDTRVGEGAQEVEREDEQRRERHRDRQRAERHRSARTFDGAHDRSVRVVARVQLLPEAGHHEQRVVDRKPESERGRQIDREDRDVRDRRDQRQREERPDDRDAADDERQRRRHEAAEHEHQQDERDRDRDGLGAREVGLDRLADLVEHGFAAAERHGQRALLARQLVADRGERVLDLRIGAVHPGEHERGVTVGAAQWRRRTEVPVGADRTDVVDVGEAGTERLPRGGRGRAVDVSVGRGREQHHVRVAATELVGEHVLGPARFRLRVVEAAALQAVEDPGAQQPREDDEEAGQAEDELAPADGEVTEVREHGFGFIGRR